ncbi:caspase family protein, partial [Sandarakinorhabdus oryzae]|uniref:caspase family protein n=1 Tax=Sandarakinorhabdus oryzae TaxID=2675220 RepID=UPI0018CBF44F
MQAILWSAALLAALAAPATAQAPAAAVVKPKIIVQAMGEGGFDVAAWSADSRFIFTASGLLRELLVWDAASGVIVDRVRLPSNPKSLGEFMKLDRMQLLPDGRTLRLDGEVLDPESADLRAGRAYQIDIFTRQVSMVAPRPLRPLPAGQNWQTTTQLWMKALGTIHSGMTEMAPADALRLLPAAPRSPDGRWQIERALLGFTLRDSTGSVRELAPAKTVLGGIDDAELSPDDKRLAFLSLQGDDSLGADSSQVFLFDLTVGRFLTPVTLKGDYDQVRWINPNQYYVLAQDSSDDPLDDAAPGLPPPALLIDAASGQTVRSAPARCFMAVLPDGGLVGAGLANCRSNAGTDRTLQRLVEGKWRPLPGLELERGAYVRLLATSPKGDRLAVVVRAAAGNGGIAIINAQTGAIEKSTGLTKDISPTRIGFTPDGQRVWFAGNASVLEWQLDQPQPDPEKPITREFSVRSLLPTSFASQGNRLLIGGAFEERIQAVDLVSGGALPAIDFPGATSVGFMRTRPILWAASSNDGLRLWNSRTGEELMTIMLLPGQRFVVVAADGRYDTNLGPDSESFRWLMSDEPFTSLAPQTLMRDYYEPQLITKLMDCTLAGTCARVLHPVPPVAGLNRLLPEVRITDVQPADTPGQVVVQVEARETRDAARGRRSGLFNVKLLLDNRQIEQDPPHFQQKPSPTLTEWRELNQLEDVDAAGLWTRRFQVDVPTHNAGKPMEFAAYAFNSDRVKSNTARRRWVPPANTTPARPRRAWVLTIGVNDYAERRLDLNFAVPDARMIASRLAAIPGYEMRHISLTSAPAADGQPARQVTRADVLGVLGFLSGFPPEMEQAIRLQDVHKLRNLEQTTPDDIVIISFSGHGFASATGQFALVPSDARWPVSATAPDPRSVISAEDLTIWLGFMQASEIAFIIDACHSGAAVNTPNFKPGPMGDSSLGQLAFDKGLRILAATQADDVALENAALAQGFLTAALGEGLTDSGGPADLDRDGKVLLDEWLRYAVARLPSLEEEVRRGGGAMAARGVRLVMRAPAAAPPKSQEPSLFDFNAAPSPV